MPADSSDPGPWRPRRTRRRMERRRAGACAAGALLAALLIAGCPSGNRPPSSADAPGAAPAEPAPLPPGWLLVVGAEADAVRTHAPAAAFALAPGESLDPGTPAPGLACSFETSLRIDEPATYRLGFEAEGGSATLTLYDTLGNPLATAAVDRGSPGHDATWTDWTRLPAGEFPLIVRFARAGDAPARLRALWQRRGEASPAFRAEPIPHTATGVPRHGEAAAAAGLDALHGRVLLGEFNCLACHAAGDAALASASLRPGPLLDRTVTGADPSWLLAWMLDPASHRAGTTMPDLFSDSPDDRRDAESIVAYLSSLAPPAGSEGAADPSPEAALIEQGGRVYHAVGCVACHGPLNGAQGPPPAAPFGNLAGKWTHAGLASFLQDPAAWRPAGRMPSLNLSAEEASAVAAFLVDRWGQGRSAAAVARERIAGPAGGASAPEIEAGRRAFAARGCAACHEVREDGARVASTLAATPLAELAAQGGCLDREHTGSPRFSLTDLDRRRLAAGLSSAARSREAAAPIDAGRRTILALGCLNCHERNGEGGVDDALNPYFGTLGTAELGDEGRLPPHLTGVGWKLRTPWLREVLTASGRARPYLATRMPQFGAPELDALPEALAKADGVWPNSDVPAPAPTEGAVLAGRALAGGTGLNCLACHVWGDRPPAGTVGIDLTRMTARLRYDWWTRYIQAPTRFKPGTRMTPFFATGRSGVRDVYDGDPERQAQALWAYLSLGDRAPEPAGLPGGSGHPLRVADRPVVFRTFLKDAGARGIAVGFPIGVHFAFDAERVRLVSAWQGEFLDAAAVWEGRGGQFTGPLGTPVWSAPPGPPLVRGPRPEAWPAQGGRDAGYRFRGYALRDDGVPVFKYEIAPGAFQTGAALSVSEAVQPGPPGGSLLRRSFEIAGLGMGEQVWVNAGAGTAALADLANAFSEFTPAGGGTVWFGLTPLDAGKPLSFTLEITP